MMNPGKGHMMTLNKATDTVIIKYLNSICSVTVTKLETSSSQKGAILKCKVDTGSKSNPDAYKHLQNAVPKNNIGRLAELANYKNHKVL